MNEKNKNIAFFKTNSDKPAVRKIGANIRLVFMQDEQFIGRFRFNIFLQRPEILKAGVWVGIESNDIQTIVNEIQIKYPFFDGIAISLIKDEIIEACQANPASPPLEYIKSIKWDEKPRLDSWLIEVFKVADNPYHRYIGRQWIKHLVQRLKYPGSKFDNILIIEGDQGARKSTTLRALANLDGKNLFNETTTTPDNGKDFIEQLQGNIIMEFAEGAIMGYKNQNKLKAFITEQSDKYRPPYARNLQEFPRQVVFAMTTNDKEYLKDATGERRYWPIEIPTGQFADSEWVIENRDQLFAEAYTLTDEKFQEMPASAEIIWEEMLESRKVYDSKLEYIIDWYESLTLESKEAGVTFEEIKLKMDDDESLRTEKVYPQDIAGAFTKTLKLTKRRISHGSKRIVAYFPTERTNLEHHGDVKSKIINETDYDQF